MSTVEITKQMVGIGQIHTTRDNELLEAILGSCVGVVLYHPLKRIATMAHVVLPDSAGREGSPGKFANTAIPHLIELMTGNNIPKLELLAKIAGGSNMFGSNGPMQVGEKNILAVKKILESQKIKIVSEHVGGKKGRRVFFTPLTSELKVDIVGKESEVI